MRGKGHDTPRPDPSPGVSGASVDVMSSTEDSAGSPAPSPRVDLTDVTSRDLEEMAALEAFEREHRRILAMQSLYYRRHRRDRGIA